MQVGQINWNKKLFVFPTSKELGTSMVNLIFEIYLKTRLKKDIIILKLIKKIHTKSLPK